MNPWRGLGGLPRSVWTVFMATLINRAGTMVLPFLVLYMTRSLGFSAAGAGLALTAYGVGALVTGPLAGRLCDKVGAIRVAEGVLLLSGAIVMLLPLARGYGGILGIVLIWAVTGEAFRPAVLTVTTDMVAPEQRRTAFALVRLAVNLGMSVGPAVGGFLAMVSFPALFLVDGATSILAGVVLAASRYKERARAREGREVVVAAGPTPGALVEPLEEGGSGRDGSPLADRRLVYFLLGLIPVVMVFFQIQAAMPLHLVHHLRMPEAAYGLLFTLNTLMVILIEVPLNTATAHWPHRVSLSLGAFLIGLGFGGMALATGYLGVALTVVVWTFGEMIFLPASTAYVADISPPGRRGQYMGLFTMAFSVAFTIGPWLGAAAMERFGPAVLWTGAFGLGCLTAAMMGRVGASDADPARRTEDEG